MNVVEQGKFVLINLAVVTLLVMFFSLRKRPKNPTQLQLGKIKPDIKAAAIYKKPADGAGANTGTGGGAGSSSRAGVNGGGAAAGATASGASARARSLNCIFVYNGHSWDAFEVLGIPAGAPLEMAQASFQQMLAKTSSDSHEFLRAAIDAIQRHYLIKN